MQQPKNGDSGGRADEDLSIDDCGRDEFIAAEIKAGKLDKNLFTKESRLIKLHGHCQQKALSSVSHSVTLLSFPENYKVETIPSGCCGMAPIAKSCDATPVASRLAILSSGGATSSIDCSTPVRDIQVGNGTSMWG